MMEEKLIAVAQQNSLLSAVLDGFEEAVDGLTCLQWHSVSSDHTRPDVRVNAVLELQRAIVELRKLQDKTRIRFIWAQLDRTI